MAFQSYCWNIGTTSFRVYNLNYKIERQLQMLNELWSDKENKTWDFFTQEKYYNIMHDKEFVTGEAERKDKDARQKTSGLVEIGVIDRKRRITEVGNKIIEIIVNGDFEDDNIFDINKDSFIYLKQLLKMQKMGTNIKVKPFIVLIYFLIHLGYLNREEFTYLLPLCLKNSEAKDMVETIKRMRKKEITIENIIQNRMNSMENYQEALEFMNNNNMDTFEKFAKVDMNRKSKDNSNITFRFYKDLLEIVQKELNEEALNIILEFIKSQSAKNSKVAKYWKEYFGYTSKKLFSNEWKTYLKSKKIFNAKSKIEFNTEFFRIMHTAKWKATLEEYADLNRRYFLLTDIILFRDDKIELDILPKYYFFNISEELLNTEFINYKNYEKYIGKDIEFDKIYECLNINMDEIITQIKVDYPESNISIKNVNKFIQDERSKRFEMLIENKFKKESLIALFKNIENDERKEVEEYIQCEATIPTILEYILAIAWYRISNKTGNVLEFMKLSLDANLLPKNHAGGGTADIVYKYKNNGIYNEHYLLLEATLTDSTSQRKAEMEPVSRHLIRNMQEYGNEYSYAVFVANNLNQEVLSDFRSRKNYWYKGKNNQEKKGLKIIPLSIDDIIIILKKELEYNELYELFEKAYRDEEINDLNWYDILVKEKIENI